MFHSDLFSLLNNLSLKVKMIWQPFWKKISAEVEKRGSDFFDPPVHHSQTTLKSTDRKMNFFFLQNNKNMAKKKEAVIYFSHG